LIKNISAMIKPDMMRRIALLAITSIILAGCTLPSFFKAKYAAIQITSSPTSEVYLDGEKVGETPFKSEKLKSKDYSVRLVPEESLSSWETIVTLQPRITTVINYEFGQDRQSSGGEILNLEPLADSEAVEIAVISIPDNASVKFDGQPKGFTPLPIKNLEAGDHVLTVSAPGHKQRRIDIKLVKGHKLTVDVQLPKEALLQEETATPSAEEKEELKITPSQPTKISTPSAEQKRPYVEILDTPTGWLRVRENPTTAEENEITKINPGETYPYLESNDTGWHKISLPDGKEGWISGRYAKVYK
jgi:hypothetical protein